MFILILLRAHTKGLFFTFQRACGESRGSVQGRSVHPLFPQQLVKAIDRRRMASLPLHFPPLLLLLLASSFIPLSPRQMTRVISGLLECELLLLFRHSKVVVGFLAVIFHELLEIEEAFLLEVRHSKETPRLLGDKPLLQCGKEENF